jgi:hypothetical protein
MSGSLESEESTTPASGQERQETAHRWLDALNSFLECVYLQADVSTGC